MSEIVPGVAIDIHVRDELTISCPGGGVTELAPPQCCETKLSLWGRGLAVSMLYLLILVKEHARVLKGLDQTSKLR
jgi:hypothetical protein